MASTSSRIEIDVARQTPGCEPFECPGCGAKTHGAEGIIGAEYCTECDELAGLDNMVNDSGELIDEETRERVADLLVTIRDNGGDGARALETCDYLQT